jgi:flagellar hook assembly protein FlgD
MSAGTKLRFDLPAAAPVSIDLLDLQGRRMRSIASGIQSAGSHTLAFDGIDDAGQRLRNGAYFVRFSSGGMTRVHKLVVLH